MVIIKPLYRNLLAIVFPMMLFGALILMTLYGLWKINDTLALAISVDLILTIPIIYFLTIRTTSIPKTTVVPIMIIGLLIGSFLLPVEHQSYITLFKTWILPVVEITILSYVLYKVSKAIRLYKIQKSTSPDFFAVLKSVSAELLPKPVVILFATEVAVLYYGFISWRTRKLEFNEFTYHKKSGSPALLYSFIFIIGVETFAIHLLLAEWNNIVAWVLTGLSIYTAFQVMGFAKSLSKRPISITNDELQLRYGIMNEVHISISDIDSIVQTRSPIAKMENALKLSPLGDLESHNVLLSVSKEYTLNGLYGMKKKFKNIAFSIDDPQKFIKMINAKL